MRILVSGVTGFAGGALAEALLDRPGAQVFGLSRAGTWPPLWAQLANRITLHKADLHDPQSIEKLLRQLQPEQVYHLAGYAPVGRSFQEPDAAWAGNLTVTRALYDAVAHWGGRPRVLFVGSGLIYGDSGNTDDVQSEDTPLRPNSTRATPAWRSCGRGRSTTSGRDSPRSSPSPTSPASWLPSSAAGSRRCSKPATSARAAT